MSECKKCGEPIVWRETQNGKWMPDNPDGTLHFETCPHAKDFKKGNGRTSQPPNGELAKKVAALEERVAKLEGTKDLPF